MFPGGVAGWGAGLGATPECGTCPVQPR